MVETSLNHVMNRDSPSVMMKSGFDFAHPGCHMARYTRSITVAVPANNLQPLLIDILQSCNFEVIYKTEDYLMARETLGQVPFGKLVVVEVLIDSTISTDRKIRLNFVIKNEELPLQANNHCHQMFNLLGQAIEGNKNWELVESTTEV